MTRTSRAVKVRGGLIGPGIPGARGCTKESCEFRDLVDDFRELGLSIDGLST